MLAAFLLTLREGFEIALILGMVFGILNKLNRSDLNVYVWIGTGAAALVCAALGVIFYLAGTSLSGTAQSVFEGASVLLAAGILSWMIFWMQRQTTRMRQHLETRIKAQSGLSSGWPMAWLAFLSVTREGIELALFLIAAAFVSNAATTLAGAAGGIVLAVFLGWLLFSSTRKFSVKNFFRISNFILILFAAGLVAHGLHELTEAGLIPGLIAPLYNLNAILSDESFLGQFLSTLFGYTSNPTLTETLAYIVYFVAMFAGLRWFEVTVTALKSANPLDGPPQTAYNKITKEYS